MPEPLRVLILEDNPADAELVQFELQEAGIVFNSKVVMTEEDFIRQIQEHCPDLILSDYDLPKYNGALALAEARRRCPDTPFILVTGAVTEDRAIDILTQGAKDYVLKNRLNQRLVPAIKRALAEAEEHRARKQAEEELRESHRTLEERVKIRTAELEAEMVARKKTEEELRDSEERQRLVLQASSLGTFEVDLQTGEGQWNATEFELLGLKPGDVKASPDSFFRYVHPDDVGQLQSDWEEATRTGKLDSEFRMIRADGRECWLAGKGSFIFNDNPDGHDTGTSERARRFMGVNFDITARKRAEEAETAAQRRVQSIIDNTPAIVYALDLEERFLLANTALAELLNSTPGKMIGKRRHEFMPKDDADWHEANDRQVIESVRALEFEEYSQLKGRSITWLTTKFPLRDAQGRIYGVAGISADVSERKQTEEERQRLLNDVQHERDKLSALINSMTDEIWFADAEKKLTLVNPAVWNEFGSSIGDAKDVEKIAASFKVYRSDGTPRPVDEAPPLRALQGEVVTKEEEIVLIPTKGEMRRREVSAAPVRDIRGAIIGSVSVARDISERKKTEEALKDSEKRYRRLFEASRDGVLILDADTGKVDDVNPFLLQLLGYSYDELCGQHIWELGVFKDIAASKDAFKTLQDNEYVRYEDLPLETRTGQSIAVEFVSNVYLVDHSKVVQCNIRDITERKRAEAERREALAKAEEGERILRTLMEYVPEGITIADAPDVKIRMVSRYGREMLGGEHDRMTAGEVADQWKVYEKDGRTPMAAADLPLSRAMLNGETVLNKELVQVNAQGQALPLLCNSAPIRDDSGRITGGIVAWRDITKLKQVEEELEKHRRNLEEMVHERTAALRRSQELLIETQRISKVGGWEFDVSTGSVFWTDEVYRIHGLTKDYDPSNPEQDITFYAPEDQKRIANAFQRAVTQGEPYDLELQLVQAQGGSLWVRTMGRAEKKDGKVVRVFGNILDITETKKAQKALQDLNATLEERVAERTEELRQSEERFRLALRNAPVSVAVQDHDLVYTWAYNQRTRQPDEIAGKTDADLFAPEDLSWILEEKHRVLESGTEVHVQHWLTSNGRRLFLDLHYEPLRDSAGVITGIGIAVVDLTEQKLAEDALREREATLRGILDAVKESIWLFHPDGRVLLANATALHRFGKPEAEVIGKHTRDILPPALATARMARYQQVTDSRQPLEFEDDRAGINFLHSFYPVLDAQGHVTAIACFSRDITEHKRVEDAMKLDAEVRLNSEEK